MSDGNLLLQVCHALGWQGGTVHQVLHEIQQLRVAGKMLRRIDLGKAETASDLMAACIRSRDRVGELRREIDSLPCLSRPACRLTNAPRCTCCEMKDRVNGWCPL